MAGWGPAPPGVGAGTGTVVGVAGVGVSAGAAAAAGGRVRPVPAACLVLPPWPPPPRRLDRPAILPAPRLPPNNWRKNINQSGELQGNISSRHLHQLLLTHVVEKVLELGVPQVAKVDTSQPGSTS